MYTRLWPVVLLVALTACAPAASAQDTRTVNEPVFPAVCTVLPAQMAIVNNGPASETTIDTARIQAALTSCGAGNAVELAGSGTNFAFLSAPLNLPSGVSLIVDGGVTLFASRNREDYQTSPVSASTDECGTQGLNGNGCKNFLLFNNNSTNVNSGLYGYGVIDGRGYATTLKAGADTGVSWWVNADAIPSGYSQNNPILMKLSKSTNFTLYKITLRNSAMFHVGWSGTGFTAWGVKIQSPWTSHNTDGIDPVGSNVTITNASISNGDDQIAVGASSASQNITIQNSTLYSGHGLSVGSYTQGGLTNMLVQNVNMAGQPGDSNEDGIRLKSAPDRGGVLKNLTYQNICMRDVRRALYLTPFYNTNSGTLIPQFTNISLNNIHVLAPTGTYANIFSMQGFDANHTSTVLLNNVVFDSLTASNVSPATTNTSFTLAGNVYPAFLQSLTGTGVTYTGTATANATPAYDCTAASTFPYEVGELYLATPAATNLRNAAITTAGSVTLNAMLQPAKSIQAYSGTAGTYAGAALMTQPVQFLEGTTVVGSAALGANGTLASLVLSGVAAGPHAYTAYYPGDLNYAALAFGAVTVNVTQATAAATTTTLTTGPVTIPYGTGSTLTAAITTANAAPGGSVQFLDNSTVLATIAVTGKSAATTQYLGGGAHSLTAIYSGDPANATSTSPAVLINVTPAAPFATVTAAPGTVGLGSGTNPGTTLTASLVGISSGAVPTGTVRFYDGSTLLVSATLDSTGKASAFASFTTVGAHSVNVQYAGDTNYAATTSSGITVTVPPIVTTTTLTLSPSTVAVGSTVTFTAAVSSSTASVPAGTITFANAGGPVGTASLSGTATATLTLLESVVGTQSVTATYAATSNYAASTSAPAALTVTGTPSFTLTAAPASVTLGPGASATSVLTITPVNGFIGAVTLNCSSPVPYIVCSPSLTTFNVGGTSAVNPTVNISVAASVAANHEAPLGLPRAVWFAFLLPLFAFNRRGKHWHGRVLVALLLAVSTAGLGGCGSSTSTPIGSALKPPPAGLQTLIVTASSGSSAITTPISVNVSN